MARTGRPRLENPRSHGIFIRLTQEEDAQIKEYASKHNLTITQTLVEGFRALKEREGSGDERQHENLFPCTRKGGNKWQNQEKITKEGC